MSEGPYTKAPPARAHSGRHARPLSEMVADDISGAGISKAAAEKMGAEKLKTLAPKFASEAYIHIVVAGSDAGKFSSAPFTAGRRARSALNRSRARSIWASDPGSNAVLSRNGLKRR